MTQVRIGRKFARFSLDVEFTIPPGITALYGPPGSGKSLILESIAGFATPDSGRILLDDAILFDAQSRLNLPARRRQCGFLFSADSLFPHLTLRGNLRFAALGFPRLDRHRRVAETLEHFQLSGAAGLRPDELTREQRLRAEIARMLIPEPKLILLDRPGLGESVLLELRAATATPILLVTSDLDLCCTHAAQLILLESGRIAQHGVPREVLDNPDSVEAARLLGIPNLFEATIAALDPGRNSSRLETEHFAFAANYIPGHFRGDRVWVAIYPHHLRLHPAGAPQGIPAELVRVSRRTRDVRLEFAHEIFVDVSPEEYEQQKDNKGWQVEFPPACLKIL